MKYCSLYLALALLAACTNNPQTPPATTSTPPPPATNAPMLPSNQQPATHNPNFSGTYLEGFYATSTAPGYEAYRLFDDDPATGWRTRPGAGPDEGLMLYFANALPLRSVTVMAETGSFQGDEGIIQTYVNGQLGDSGRPGQAIALPKGTVKSLYLRFENTGKEQESRRQQRGDDAVTVRTFPRDAFIGIQSLTILDDKGQPLPLAPPARVEGQVTASSTLAPEAAYSPANLFDARKEFGWAEGNAASDGVGESLTFQFNQPVNITAVQIWNGYQRSAEHFSANARVRDFEFGATGGPAHTYTLRDTRAGQKIELQTAVTGQSFTLTIKTVYPGKTYKDLALSDLVFFDGAHPFVLQSPLSARYTSATATRAAPSPLAAVLDRRIANEVTGPDEVSVTNQSLILRADGTFVLYSRASGVGEDAETLADGNWELLDATPGAARVKVFGKWYDFDSVVAYYEGKRKAEATRIFKDELTVSADRVVGTKMIGTFYLK